MTKFERLLGLSPNGVPFLGQSHLNFLCPLCFICVLYLSVLRDLESPFSQILWSVTWHTCNLMLAKDLIRPYAHCWSSTHLVSCPQFCCILQLYFLLSKIAVLCSCATVLKMTINRKLGRLESSLCIFPFFSGKILLCLLPTSKNICFRHFVEFFLILHCLWWAGWFASVPASWPAVDVPYHFNWVTYVCTVLWHPDCETAKGRHVTFSAFSFCRRLHKQVLLCHVPQNIWQKQRLKYRVCSNVQKPVP